MIGPRKQRMTTKESKAGYARAAERSFKLCEGCGTAEAIQMHHRLHRSHGGDEHVYNLFHLCLSCHKDAHQSEDRYRNGWAVKSGFDPALTPVMYRGELVMLTVDGGIA